MTLCFSKSSAVLSSAVVTTMLAPVLKIATVATKTLSIFAAFKALFIVSLYTLKLMIVTAVFETNSNCLSLYAVSELTFALCFCAFSVTFVHDNCVVLVSQIVFCFVCFVTFSDIFADIFCAAFCAYVKIVFVLYFLTVSTAFSTTF